MLVIESLVSAEAQFSGTDEPSLTYSIGDINGRLRLRRSHRYLLHRNRVLFLHLNTEYIYIVAHKTRMSLSSLETTEICFQGLTL